MKIFIFIFTLKHCIQILCFRMWKSAWQLANAHFHFSNFPAVYFKLWCPSEDTHLALNHPCSHIWSSGDVCYCEAIALWPSYHQKPLVFGMFSYEQSGKWSNQEFNFIMFKKCHQNRSGFTVHSRFETSCSLMTWTNTKLSFPTVYPFEELFLKTYFCWNFNFFNQDQFACAFVCFSNITSFTFLKKSVYVSMSVYIHLWMWMPTEVRGGHWVPWN